MPITDDLLDHDYFGPILREKLARGHEEGREAGRMEGRAEGYKEALESERQLLRRMIEKRFGLTPEWALNRIDGMGTPEIEATGLRLFDAASVEDLFA
jgi:hypothetical protein